MAYTTCVFALLSMNSTLLPQIPMDCPLGSCNIKMTDLRKCRIDCPKFTGPHINGTNPGDNKNGTQPGIPGNNGTNPGDNKNGTQPGIPGNNGTNPGHSKNGTQPGIPGNNGTNPGGNKNGTQPGIPDINGKNPGDNKNGTQPEIPDNKILEPAPEASGYMICKAVSGFMYKYHKTGATYKQAESVCREEGALLVSIHSAQENECIYRMTRNKKKDPLDIYEAVWIGLRRVKETMFMWIDESPLNYKNWAKGEPNNLGGKENCVAIYSKGINCTLENDHLKRWIDIPCDYKLYGGFVCKKRRRKH